MKSVLISIQPKWVEKICEGEKTIEVRKTRPKLETPFKCYVYCTKGEQLFNNTGKITKSGVFNTVFDNHIENINGKAIGEFVCDKVFDITPEFGKFKAETQYVIGWKSEEDDSCLSWEDYYSYLGRKKGYGWHISDLKIYDKPKSLEMFPVGKVARDCGCGGDMVYDKILTRPPQSWCYVEIKE